MPGSVSFVQGGSAATTARWLGRLGANATLVTARRAGCGRTRARRGGARRQGPRARRSRRRASAPDESVSWSRPAASARSSPTVPPPTGSHPDDLAPGLVRRRSTLSTCRSTRCSASRSARPAVAAIELGAGRGRPRQHRSCVDRPAPGVVAGGSRGSWSATRRRTSCSRPRPRRRRCSAAYGVEGLLEFAPRAVVKRGANGAHASMARDGGPSACASRWPRNR